MVDTLGISIDRALTQDLVKGKAKLIEKIGCIVPF